MNMTRHSALGDFAFSGSRAGRAEGDGETVRQGAGAGMQWPPGGQNRFLEHVRRQIAREGELRAAGGRARFVDPRGAGGAGGLYSAYSRASIGEGESTRPVVEEIEGAGGGESGRRGYGRRRDEERKQALRKMVTQLGETAADRHRRTGLARERERARIRERERADRARAQAGKPPSFEEGSRRGGVRRQMSEREEMHTGGNHARDVDVDAGDNEGDDKEILRVAGDILKIAGDTDSPLTIRETARIQQEALGGFPWGNLRRYQEPSESDDGDSAFLRVHVCARGFECVCTSALIRSTHKQMYQE